ncbi:MAG: dihydroneopterin aldolase [Microthrixaceae bacterium]
MSTGFEGSGAPDTIEVRGLTLTAIVGVLPEERERPQPLRLDLSIEVDLIAAGLSDALADTVDYAAVCDRVVQVAQSSRPQLLEKLAADMAAAVLALDNRMSAVRVCLDKLRPPVPHQVDSTGVCITRRAH